ncbi:dihydrofolate reductase family protein [Paenibacillus sp. 1P07SE]|uniref:dihydrofolate reductase family protein n=1 Tax=Paenibacillus sp. 1P07SE TaxID=3132209 RepID=UPI0039A736E5
MRRVIYSQMVSLDGFIEGPRGDISWSAPDEELFAYIQDREAQVDMHLYGRHTYENMAAYWPTADEQPLATAQEIAFAQSWKQVEKVVFSRTLEGVEWNSRLVRDNIQHAVEDLKARRGGDMLLGGAGLAATFMELGLIDEFHLYTHPVLLGDGKPFFPALQHKVGLELVEARRFGGGVVMLHYRRQGERGAGADG